jgi:hypothetical protein
MDVLQDDRRNTLESGTQLACRPERVRSSGGALTTPARSSRRFAVAGVVTQRARPKGSGHDRHSIRASARNVVQVGALQLTLERCKTINDRVHLVRGLQDLLRDSDPDLDLFAADLFVRTRLDVRGIVAE